ncbi:MAG TPA: alpha/beta hydrolase [Acidimicrobiia bacterium]|nr:alpha/beta hydrolase [Acidimicrobiia bacterium]
MIRTREFDDHVAEARAINAVIADVSPPLRLATREDIETIRRMEGDPEGPFAAFVGSAVLPVEERTVPGPAGDIPIRVACPDTIDAVYVDIHGGAWIIGSAAMMDPENTRLAAACNVATVSIEYRLAPEHPWPAGADDCEAVVAWLLEHAAAEFGTDRLLIGGASAGATLSAITLLRVRDRLDAIERFAGANLVFGAYDISRTPSQRRREDTLIIDAETIRQVVPWVFQGVDAEGLRDPGISALYADLHDLPPALFTVGTDDPLLDDTLFMAARWEAAGNDAELIVCPESPHGFTMFPTAMARAVNDRIHDFVRRCIKNTR